MKRKNAKVRKFFGNFWGNLLFGVIHPRGDVAVVPFSLSFLRAKAMWYLENVDMFELLCPHKFAEYSSRHVFRNFTKDEPIYWEDDAASTVYLIAEGKVKIASYTENGEERVKAILGKGELFGEMALFGEERRRESATAVEKTEICPISVEQMHDLMRDYKEFALSVRKLIGRKFQRIERRLEILLFKDADKRLAEFIKDLARESGAEERGVVVVRHIFTQQNIADLIGVSRPTLNILLNELRASGDLDFKRGELRIKNRAMLAA